MTIDLPYPPSVNHYWRHVVVRGKVRVLVSRVGDKKPLTEHGYLDASTEAGRIDAWWDEWPAANVAIATAGLVVIDVDGAANPWPADPDRMLDLAVAPLATTPGGGCHRIFRQPAGKGYRCTTNRLAPRVDTRADGGYLVLPPSVRAGGTSYAWVPGLDLDAPPAGLPEPPGWLVAELDVLAGTATGITTLPTAAADPGQVLAGLDSNPIPDGQRNDTLTRLAGCMRRVGMSGPEMVAALHEVNRRRCRPPLPPREVEVIAASVARYEPDAVTVALVENHYAQQFAFTPAEPGARLADIDLDSDPGPVPAELLRVPGFVDEVMSHTLACAPYPEPVLAFAGALALQAFLAGRKVRDAADNRTNLYLLALANSGAGKDFPRKVNQRVLQAADLADGLGDSFASGEGLEDRLAQTPAMLFQTDEIDGLMSKIATANDARFEGIMTVLLKLNTSANALYPMRVKVGREAGFIDQPCLCLFGTAIPTNFYQSLSPKMLSNGFLARTLVLETSRRGAGQEGVLRDLPAGVLETARWWRDFLPGGRGGNLVAWHPQPRVVEASAEATAILRGLRERADKAYERAEQDRDDGAMAIWSRAYEKARRLALIYACSENYREPSITAEAARWACAFVEHQTRRMLSMAAAHVSQGEFDARCKQVLATLTAWRAEHGDAWMPYWRISRKHPWGEREHDEVRRTLLEQQRIEYQQPTPGQKGRPGRFYRLIPPGEAVDS